MGVAVAGVLHVPIAEAVATKFNDNAPENSVWSNDGNWSGVAPGPGDQGRIIGGNTVIIEADATANDLLLGDHNVSGDSGHVDIRNGSTLTPNKAGQVLRIAWSSTGQSGSVSLYDGSTIKAGATITLTNGGGSKTAGPAWLKVAEDGALSGVPTYDDLNGNTFTVEASDGNGGVASVSLSISIDPVITPSEAPKGVRDVAASYWSAVQGEKNGKANGRNR